MFWTPKAAVSRQALAAIRTSRPGGSIITDKKQPEAVEDADLDDVEGGALIQRNESNLTAFHGSDFNAAMGNSGHGKIHGSDFNAIDSNDTSNGFATAAGGDPNV